MSGIAVCIPASTAGLQRVLFTPGLLDLEHGVGVQASDHKHHRSTEQPTGRDDVDGSAFSAGTFLIVEERDYIDHELG